jgi:hypothetical protein
MTNCFPTIQIPFSKLIIRIKSKFKISQVLFLLWIIFFHNILKDRNVEPERGGVNGRRQKLYSRIRHMNPISLEHLRKLLLPSSRNHWSATEPRSKTQPTATTHTQRKHTRHGCWQPKPVRPVSEISHTASVGLSLTQAGETGQTGLTNRSDRLCPETPQRPKTPQEPFHIWTKEAIAQQRLPYSKTLLDSPQGETGQTGLGNRSGRFWPGQSGRTQPAGKTHTFHQMISWFVPRIKVRLWG